VDLPEAAFIDESLDREEVPVPPAIVEDRQ